jgi:putative flippase GtrA
MRPHFHALTRFAGIGVASTLAYALLFLVLAGPLGSAGASATALAITAVANTAANRRLTFGVRGRAGLVRQQLAGLAVFVVALVLTNGALALTHQVDPHTPRLLEAAVLVLASAAATVTRYVALATWVFRPAPAGPTDAPVLPLPVRGD